jgi:hypothetical protein
MDFQLAQTGATTTAELNSVYDIIESVAVFAKSGKLISKVEEYGLWMNYYKRWSNNPDYFHGNGEMEGFPDIKNRDAVAPTTDIKTNAEYFQIPLDSLSPVFSSDKLYPPMLLEGARIEIRFKDPSTAFTDTGGVVTSYTLSDISLRLDGSLLHDKYHGFVMDIAASKGLEIDFTDVFHSGFSAGANTNNVIQLNKSASMALRVNAIARDTTTITTANLNSFSSVPNVVGTGVKDIQWRIGSHLYPSERLSNSKAIYKNTFSAYGNQGSVSLAQTVDATDGHHMISQALELSSTLNLSGQKLSNSRQLECRLNFGSPIAGGATIDFYLEHTKLLRVFLNGKLDILD